MLGAGYHDQGSVVGQGFDDQFEFKFALDILLDGLDKLRVRQPSGRRAVARSARRRG